MQQPLPPRPAARRRSRLRSFVRLILLGLLLVNGIAWLQAYTMTHFVPGSQSLDQSASAPLTDKLWMLTSRVKLPRPENHRTPRDQALPFEVRHIPLPNNERLEAWFVPHPQPRGVVLMFPG